MSVGILWTKPAVKALERLDAPTRRRIIGALDRLAESGHGDVKMLKGAEEEWRLRVGTWRVRFTWQVEPRSLVILDVRARGSVYKP
ncbi:MAG: type II toxin-antitoxin system RelE/ParE family toxin [Deltaproteobacteria bacterium]|nr:type II toxin-antitoxin system RelE/ParE family toxin [Deltaproteobacteria bacterium]